MAASPGPRKQRARNRLIGGRFSADCKWAALGQNKSPNDISRQSKMGGFQTVRFQPRVRTQKVKRNSG